MHAHAEANAVFPDDSTADQLFGHRQFESYRRLGYYQADRLLATVATGSAPAATGQPDQPAPGWAQST